MSKPFISPIIYNAPEILVNTTSPSIILSTVINNLGYTKDTDTNNLYRGLYLYWIVGLGTWQFSFDNGLSWLSNPSGFTISGNSNPTATVFGLLKELVPFGGNNYIPLIRYTSTSVEETAGIYFGALDLDPSISPSVSYTSYGASGITQTPFSVINTNQHIGTFYQIENLQIKVVLTPTVTPPTPSTCTIPAKSYTVRDLLSSSLRKLGVIQAGEVVSDDEIEDVMECANDVLVEWQLSRLMCHHIVNETFPLIAGKVSYTIGHCADFNTNRPVRIERAYIDVETSSPVVTLPLKELTFEQYGDIVVKSTQSPISRGFYYEPDFSTEANVPWGKIFLWPVPSFSNYIQLWSWNQISEFTSLDQIIYLPPAYKKALRYAVAVEVASEYGIDPPQSIIEIAKTAKASVKRVNQEVPVSVVDGALMGRSMTFNYLTGE